MHTLNTRMPCIHIYNYIYRQLDHEKAQKKLENAKGVAKQASKITLLFTIFATLVLGC